MTYNESINYLESLAGFGIRPGLERITKLLEMLGNPQNKYKTIHVTGTNGKGSVCSMLSTILTTANLKTGLFTSPHLISYRERFKINDIDIDENHFAKLIEDVKFFIEKVTAENFESPTLFETLTAAAFKYFADENVDYAVIEVGLGGLLDSTNVIIPEVSVITNVANDHAEKCGGDIFGIARYKAGIIKEKIPVVTGAVGEPLKIIRETAQKKHSKIFVLGEDFFVDENLKISLQGEYQKSNAAIAIKTAQIINSSFKIPYDKFKWSGRFEIFDFDEKKIVIDGAHNGAGAEALKKSLDKKFPNGRRIFLFGVLKDKDIDVIIKKLFGKNDFVIVTKPDSERAAEPDEICRLLKNFGIESIAVENNFDAFEKFIHSDENILICAGSLYLIGNISKMILDIKKNF